VAKTTGTTSAEAPSLESAFFRSLNAIVEPAVRAGLGSPGILPAGLIVLETRGRVSGIQQRVPLLATLAGPHVVVSTLRADRSQWLRNARATPDVQYWLLGRPHSARAVIIMPGGAPVGDELPHDVRCIADALQPWALAPGVAFAILVTQDAS